MRGFRLLTILTSAALLASTLTLLSTTEAEAATEPFDPGHLISDAYMYDGGSMTVAQIQAFLNGKVKTCSPSAERDCLKSIRVAQPAKPAFANRCTGDIPARSSQSAAQVIFAAAQACNVSPKVLLVTLQKEQGLVTSTSPTATKYKIATGYGCPDGSACDDEFFGFANQVYWAARAFQAYKNSPSSFPSYQPGVRAIKYHPDAVRCGSKTVSIDNVATTALYTYTPYTPNAAALANIDGTGDSCSSYGNRNFWRYYNSWFGNTGAGDFLITSSPSAALVLDGKRWALSSSNTRLRATIETTDAAAKVSADYFNAVPSGGTLGLVVKSDSGNAYVLGSGKKYLLDSCTVAASVGFGCASAPASSAFLGELPTSSELVGKTRIKVQTAAKQNYVLEGGQRREFVSSSQVGGATLGATVLVDSGILSTVPYGAPYVAPYTLTSIRGTTDYALSAASATYRVPSSIVVQTGADGWFDLPTGALDGASVEAMPAVSDFPAIFSDGTSSYVLAVSGKLELSTPAEWSASIPVLAPDIVERIPSVGSIGGPQFVRTVTSSVTYLVGDGERRKVASADIARVAAALDISTTVKKLPTASVAAIPLGDPLYAAGSVVRTSSSGPYFLIDGATSRIELSASAAKEFVGTATIPTVSSTALSGYAPASGQLLPGVTCGSKSYLAISGVLRTVTAADAAEYGSRMGFTTLDSTTCAGLKTSTTKIGVFLKYGTRYFEVENGFRTELTSKQYSAASAGKTAARTVSKYFLQLVPYAP